MVEEINYESNQKLQAIQLATIVDTASKIYQSNSNKPVKILDLATGPNGFNPKVVRRLVDMSIDYELVLSDISPKHFKIGDNSLSRFSQFSQYPFGFCSILTPVKPTLIF